MAYGSALSACEDPSCARKSRGAFFTPASLADFISRWAVRHARDRVLEPACGEAAFLVSAGNRFTALGLEGSCLQDHLFGLEVHERSACEARKKLAFYGLSCTVEVTDFLKAEFKEPFDAVVGNPPYVRFQVASKDVRESMSLISERSGVAISSLSSTWAPFVVQAAMSLKEGGRLGFVLPGELLSVNYAAPVRAFLLDSFSSLQLITFGERVFPEVQEEVVILLADGYRKGSSDCIQWRQCETLDDLEIGSFIDFSPVARDDRWSGLFASGSALRSLDGLIDRGLFVPLESWGKVALGSVTGNNSYFALSDAEFSAWGLGDDDGIALCPPGTRHLRCLDFTEDHYDSLRKNGARVKLFCPSGESLSEAARSYIAYGEGRGVNEAYKCKVRSPWWRVPLGSPPDAFITYMNAYGPNLCANSARVAALNSCHGFTFSHELREVGQELLPLACLNSATFFGAEIMGRAYGGGLLKVEPREAARLPVPSVSLVLKRRTELRAIRHYVEKALAERDFDAAVNLVDAVLVSASHDGDGGEFSQMSSSATLMRLRRKKRGRSHAKS
ncbi:class I SAM-dependent DNA methyltransferase [Adlercreutzia sp. ZJ242]|uniref:HsdM family class I SAM-dependent methyltransferase n=1 Tax=Adlercreutzia sp. ZJ242 TaxID=2709409 RepID=UPI0013ED25B3|nr:N-6 DNA methylase [Adlercreutzia sp. ZJ242]